MLIIFLLEWRNIIDVISFAFAAAATGNRPTGLGISAQRGLSELLTKNFQEMSSWAISVLASYQRIVLFVFPHLLAHQARQVRVSECVRVCVCAIAITMVAVTVFNSSLPRSAGARELHQLIRDC